MGNPELARDTRFADLISRHRHQDELDDLISTWTGGTDAHEVMNHLQSVGIPAASVLSGEGIFNDPHYHDRGLLELVDHPFYGALFPAWNRLEDVKKSRHGALAQPSARGA